MMDLGTVRREDLSSRAEGVKHSVLFVVVVQNHYGTAKQNLHLRL